MKIKYLIPVTILFSLVATPVFADTSSSTVTTPAPKASVKGPGNGVRVQLDKIRSDAKAAAMKVRGDAKAAHDTAKAAADKVKADRVAAKAANGLAKSEMKSARDAYSQAFMAFKAQREAIQKSFQNSISTARATLKSVKATKPDQATLDAAQLAFNNAVAAANKVKSDAIAALPPAPAKPVAPIGSSAPVTPAGSSAPVTP